MFRKVFPMALVLWLILAMQTQTKAETTIHVDPGDNIAAANAQARPGDTIRFAAGTFLFNGEIEFKDDVTYKGAGAGQTILDGQNTPSAFVAYGSKGWVMDGLTIQNFKQPDDGYDGGVFGIYDSAEGIIKNCTINNCSAPNAGVGDVTNSTLEVINSTINNCTAVNDGGVFGLYNTQLKMTDSYLSHISCGKDGGIFYASGGSRITIDKCQIYDCEAGEDYALGYLSGDGASLDLSNSVIGNLNAVDDWLYMCFTSDADHNRWWNNIIYGCNTASGIFLFQGPLEFLHNTLYDIHCNGKGFMALWTTQYSNNSVLSTISNNIFSACSNCSQEGCSTYYMITQRYPNTCIACGNVIYDFTTGMGDFFGPSILEENNVFGKNPLLEDPDNGDFDLLDGSPAINNGCSVGVETDQDGNTRDDQPDSGALEIQDTTQWPGISMLESPSKSIPYAVPYEPCPPCPPCPESEGVGAPIYAFSGEYYKSVVDLRIAGRGLDFIWARKYRSRVGPDTAQGNGWDFSYNIRIEQDGDDLILFDGNTRRDKFILQPDGTWAADGFYWEFIQGYPEAEDKGNNEDDEDDSDPDSSFTLKFSDTGTWQFHRPAHIFWPGRISAISDRNGNTMRFDYNTQGRLVTIHDTLDTDAHNRDITIAYNQDGFIESVTDFIGRQVRYAYYQDGDDGGSFGDLKSVTSPAVTGTPNGNDFPQGKTTVYTYSKGFADERLNHNLLTITDPRGQTYLTNIYAPTQNPRDLDFDRIVRQIWGDPGDILDLAYVPQVPSEQNGFAVIKAIVNDRVGNVQEYFFDSDNQRVVQRAYTGRADPNQPTTETQNRPTGRLRPDDPDFFETRWTYNADSRSTRIDHANGNFTVHVYELDLDPSAPRRSRGNLREIHHLPGPLEPLSDSAQIVELYEYDKRLGGCCGTNFVTREVDGRGNETLHEYDDRGNRIRTQHRIPSIVEEWEYNEFGQMTRHTLPDNGSGNRREDVYTYYSDTSDPQNGYLKSVIIDAANLALTTTYEYDAVGNLTIVTDRRGHNTRYIRNQLNQVVRRISRPVTSPNGIRYETDTYYDKNSNVVRMDIQNIDDEGVLQTNTHLTTLFEYDVLNHRIRRSQEVGAYTGALPGPPELPSTAGLPETEFITTEYEYDANRNRILVRYGEATDGRQPANVVRVLYDERDLVFRQIRADNDPDQSTTQYDYDGNGNVNRTLEGIEDNPRITIGTHDGYDRLVTSTDSMGNVATYQYDDNHNPRSVRADGELVDDDPDGDNNVRLSQARYVYDEMDRLVQTEVEFFDTDTGTPIENGLSVTTTEYTDTSQIIRITNDNRHAGEATYDTANRALTVTDAKGNTLTYNYDQNSNVISATTVEKSDVGNPDETFTTTSTYDGLDRLIQSVDNVGNTHIYSYDSKGNLTYTVDALGHERRYVRDGISRLVQAIRDLDNDGADGDGDDIITGQHFDDTSRLIERIDDNGNITSYIYDALNRSIATTYADGTQRSTTYDVHSNPLALIDGNGSVVTSTYDLLNRLTNKAIAPGAGVSGDTTFEGYAYDGLSRLIRAEDDDSVVTRSYNSRSNVTSETLNGQTIARVYDGIGNRVSCTYPGGRQIDCTFDEVERKRVISDDSGTIATYDYIGPGRVERRQFGNNTRTDYTYDGITGIPNPTGDFGVKRLIATTHTFDPAGAAAIIDDRTYKWDPMYRKVQRKDIRVGGPELTHDYQYDSIYRLVHTAVTDAGSALVRDEVYRLDGVGNRTQVSGGTNPGTYTMDPSMPISADFQMNQYTATPSDARVYDENSNLVTIDDGLSAPRNLTFDYRDRLVEYIGAQRHTYAYDVFGRRIARVVDADGEPQETHYFYDGWRVCEEQDAAGASQATYVYGLYIDEVLNMHRAGQDYYYHTDDHYNVMAVTDNTGAVRERYEYADYGSVVDPTTLAPVDGDPSALGNPYLFQGRRFDPETGLYYFRNRYLDPEQGRFVSRDPLGLWGDPGNRGNAYSFAGNDPVNRLDPFGLDSPPEDHARHSGCTNLLRPGSCGPRPDAENIGSVARQTLINAGVDEAEIDMRVAFVERMANPPFGFGSPAALPECWTTTTQDGNTISSDYFGKFPAQALGAFCDETVEVDCKRGLEISGWLAVLDVVGEQRFNDIWEYEQLALSGDVFRDPTDEQKKGEFDEAKLLPGDSVYFGNNERYNYLPGAEGGDYCGENAVYVGAELYAGYGIDGLKTAEEMRQELVEAFNDLADESQQITTTDLPDPEIMHGPPRLHRPPVDKWEGIGSAAWGGS